MGVKLLRNINIDIEFSYAKNRSEICNLRRPTKKAEPKYALSKKTQTLTCLTVASLVLRSLPLRGKMPYQSEAPCTTARPGMEHVSNQVYTREGGEGEVRPDGDYNKDHI